MYIAATTWLCQSLILCNGHVIAIVIQCCTQEESMATVAAEQDDEVPEPAEAVSASAKLPSMFENG